MCRFTPTSRANWLLVTAGMDTNGSPCAATAAATTARDPWRHGHPQRIRAVCHGRLSERWQILTRGQDDSVGEVTLNGMVPSYPQ